MRSDCQVEAAFYRLVYPTLTALSRYRCTSGVNSPDDITASPSIRQEWYENGSKKSSITYSVGSPLTIKQWNESGRLIEDTQFDYNDDTGAFFKTHIQKWDDKGQPFFEDTKTDTVNTSEGDITFTDYRKWSSNGQLLKQENRRYFHKTQETITDTETWNEQGQLMSKTKN